jgi:hypothetical protein
MGHPLNPPSAKLLLWAALNALLLAPPTWAQEVARPVYRCPGPPVLYTDAISADEARERNCRIIDGAPLTVMQTPRRPAPAAAPGGAVPASSAPAAAGGVPGTAGAANRPEARVDPAVQRGRDAEARRILTAELRREEERLEQLKREFNNGEPERRGDERNFALYQQRVAEMRALIGRKESDVAAIRRELGKLPQ